MGRTLQRYRTLFDGIKRKAPHRAYFLYGPEEYIKKEFLAELVKSSLTEGNRAFNLDVIHGDEFDADAFHDRLSSFPLFTERRMVVLKNFDALSTANKDLVIERVKALPESVVLVVESRADKMDSARLKNLKKHVDDLGLSFRFDYLSDEETIERIKTRLQKEGLAIEPEALSLMVESVGTHLSDLSNELDKVVLRAGDGKMVTTDLVSDVIGRYRTENLFDLLDRLGRPKTPNLIQRLHRLLDSGEEPVFVLAMLIRRVLQLLEVQGHLHEGSARSPRVLAGKLSGYVNPYFVERLVEQARRIEHDDLLLHLENLRWADAKLKSTSIPAPSLLATALLASASRKRLAAEVSWL